MRLKAIGSQFPSQEFSDSNRALDALFPLWCSWLHRGFTSDTPTSRSRLEADGSRQGVEGSCTHVMPLVFFDDSEELSFTRLGSRLCTFLVLSRSSLTVVATCGLPALLVTDMMASERASSRQGEDNQGGVCSGASWAQ